MITDRRFYVAAGILLGLANLGIAQQSILLSPASESLNASSVTPANILPAPPPLHHEETAAGTTCHVGDLISASTLSFRQRACLYESRLIAPSFAARAAVFSAFAQIRSEPQTGSDGAAEFARRFGVYYARRAGQSTGELLAGYLNHEDPRYHPSHQEGVWNRTRAALLSVALTHDADGGVRPAFGPVAGAFGSGLVGVACYRTHNSWGDGFRRTGFSYGTYFSTAVFREFKPDLTVIAYRAMHRKSKS